MKSADFTYAVSRVRMRETKLFTAKTLERLISQKDYQSVLRVLSELQFGDESGKGDKDIITAEEDKLWAFMSELVEDISVFDVFRLQNDYHNIKCAVKSIYANTSPEALFIKNSTIDSNVLFEAIKNRDYKSLPDTLGETAFNAMDILLKTGDGQLCDCIIDKACLDAISGLAKNSSDSVIKDYAELFVVSSNIKIAVRGSRLNNTYEFFMKSLADCETLDKETLARNAVKGFDEICSYLSETKYKEAVSYIRKSMSSFEKWCDDILIKGLKVQKYEPFSVGPLVAYILAKQNEIKAVRLILIAKLNGLDDAKINERIREMYV